MTTTTHRLADCDDLWTVAIDPRTSPRAKITGPAGESLVVEIEHAPKPRVIIRPARAGDNLSTHPHVRRTSPPSTAPGTAPTTRDPVLDLLRDVRDEVVCADDGCQCDVEDDSAPWSEHRGDCPTYWAGRIDAALETAR